MKIWKIRNKSGLHSTGGMRPSFAKVGKVWKTKGDIHRHFSYALSDSSHLGRALRTGHKSPYYECDIVEYNLIEVSATPVSDMIAEITESRETKQRKADEARKLAQEKAEKQQLAELKAKYPDD
jgi:hypothetical protein